MAYSKDASTAGCAALHFIAMNISAGVVMFVAGRHHGKTRGTLGELSLTDPAGK